jgi:hypothetical protein
MLRVLINRPVLSSKDFLRAFLQSAGHAAPVAAASSIDKAEQLLRAASLPLAIVRSMAVTRVFTCGGAEPEEVARAPGATSPASGHRSPGQ